MNPTITNTFLNGVNDKWHTGTSRLTINNSDEMQKVLASARKYGAKYRGEVQEIKFAYRDPWEWIMTLLDDSTLAATMIYNSDELPAADPYPHCLFLLHWWLDEGLVTKRITMHPMVVRTLAQPAQVRNASGNGGGTLVGYMTRVCDPTDPTNRNTPQTLEFARYKMKIYQRILAMIFASLKSRSWNGEALRCFDGLVRIFHPGVLICSLDGKEAAYFNACRAALANFPCPKCLVHKSDLHRMSQIFTLRTIANMKKVFLRASSQHSKTKKEAILKDSGLHDIEHFLWDFRFSDPYTAYSYDTLHSDDLGKWGHHLWDLLLDELEKIEKKAPFAENMRGFPRWPNLKHFNEVTTIHFTDGQSFYDILKCVLPCIVQLFPPNNVLVNCIRAYVRYRIMVGMHCMTEGRLQRLQVFIEDYEYWCTRVTEVYGKNFDFFKQHAASHVVKDIRDKGTTNHGSTRPGEGFQQEARQAYVRTNCKEVEQQMVRIDETQEAMARIRMTINNYDKSKLKTAESSDPDEARDDEEEDETPVDPQTTDHWTFGAPFPGRLMNSRAVEEMEGGSRPFANFDLRLRTFISTSWPEEGIKFEDMITIRRFKCAHITYQSLEDWRGARDIIRCNPRFHQRPRYDSLLVNMTDPGLHFARAHALFRCNLPSGRHLDIALIGMFKQSRWKPKTLWAGCQIQEEVKEYSFLSMEHVIRGALLAPVSSSSSESIHFVVDTIDADMFLRTDM
ncbi:hypothetical protein C8J57DRAFT_1454650 [Mycena rebaudengoi]|nr:hypothetical protein C8J57DRAFT_1454650 [Mycena rebaudengoi]